MSHRPLALKNIMQMQRTGGIATRVEANAQQAQIAGNFDLIIEHLKEVFDRPNGLLCEDRCFGRPGASSHLFKVPTLGFNGEANSPLALNCSNLIHPLSDNGLM
jgi:hypothetical protein